MKSAKTIKDGVKIGAQLMNLQRQVRVAVDKYKKKENALDVLNSKLKTLGADVDDRT